MWLQRAFDWLLLILTCLIIFKKKHKTYPRIRFFRKMMYPRIRIRPIPIHVSVSVSVSVLHSWRLAYSKPGVNLSPIHNTQTSTVTVHHQSIINHINLPPSPIRKWNTQKAKSFTNQKISPSATEEALEELGSPKALQPFPFPAPSSESELKSSSEDTSWDSLCSTTLFVSYNQKQGQRHSIRRQSS